MSSKNPFCALSGGVLVVDDLVNSIGHHGSGGSVTVRRSGWE
jgi:hypothetical protein